MHTDPEDIAPFVPLTVIRRIEADASPVLHPTLERQEAAVLFADISGFTRLAEKLSREGRAGAERLTASLNGFFGTIIDRVLDHGGDIVKFAGDAFMAIWPSSSSQGSIRAARHALQSALLIQHELEQTKVMQGVDLSLKIVVGVGEIMLAHVGGVYGRWEILIAGPALDQIGKIAHACGPGDVVIGEDAFAELRPFFNGRSSTPGVIAVKMNRMPITALKVTPRPIPPALAPAILAYLPAAIKSRIAAGQSAWLAEFRPSTILFVNLPDLKSGIGLERLQEAIRTVQSVVYQYEGSFNKLSVDDKGATVVAVMGLPPLAHEDDAVRGVIAATELRAELGKIGFSASIGVTTGRTFCTTVGNARRREYTVIGDNVNLSARLMQAAGGGILCDGATVAASRDKYRFEDLPPLKLKGKSDPEPVFRPLGPVEQAASHDPELIGRIRERCRLTELLHNLRDHHHGKVVLLEAEPGMGKSRLLETLLEEAAAARVPAFLGRGSSLDRRAPYQGWRGVFRELLSGEQPTACLPTPVRDQLEEILESSELAPLMGALRLSPREVEDNEVLGQLSAREKADNLRQVLFTLLERASRATPFLLVLDDAHGFDSASLALLRRLALSAPRMLLVLAVRSGRGGDMALDDLSKSAHVETIELAGLDLEDTEKLIARLLGARTVAPDALRILHEKSQGNPLVLEQLVSSLRTGGGLTVDGGRAALQGSQRLSSLPDTLQGLVTSRVDQLDPAPQLVLKTASVIGLTFTLEPLLAIYPFPTTADELARMAVPLVSASILEMETTDEGPHYHFRSRIVRDAAYELLPFSQRRQFHQSLACWYEARETGADPPDMVTVNRLAHHWVLAEVAEKAVPYLERSGELSLSAGADAESREAYQELIDQVSCHGLLFPVEQRTLWLRNLAQAHLGLGQLRESETTLLTALEILGHPLPSEGLKFHASIATEVVVQLTHRLRSARLPSTPPDAHDTRLALADILERLVEIYYLGNDPQALLLAGLRSLNISEQAGPSPELARAYSTACIAASLVPIHRLARHFAARALEVVELVDHPPSRTWVLLTASTYRVGVAEWEPARLALEENLVTCRELKKRQRWGESATVLGAVHYFQGRFERALALWNEVYDEARRAGDVLQEAWGHGGRAMNLLRLDLWEDAAREAEEALPLFAANRDNISALTTGGIRALALWRTGAHDSAVASALGQLGLIERSGSPASYFLLEGIAGVTEVLLRRWQSAPGATEVRAPAARALKAMRRYARIFPLGRPRADFLEGLHLWLDGQHERGRGKLELAASGARTLGMAFEEAQALKELRALDAK